MYLFCIFFFHENIGDAPWFKADSGSFTFTDDSNVKSDDADDDDLRGFTSVVTYDKADSHDADPDADT